jgi:hypothetical protein
MRAGQRRVEENAIERATGTRRDRLTGSLYSQRRGRGLVVFNMVEVD